MSAVVLALAWGGRNKLEAIIDNFLAILGYWTLAFGLILAIEHFWFRPRLAGYDLSAWQDPTRMPVGLAGTVALLIGIGFSFLGMAQTWVCSFFLLFSLSLIVWVGIWLMGVFGTVCVARGEEDRDTWWRCGRLSGFCFGGGFLSGFEDFGDSVCGEVSGLSVGLVLDRCLLFCGLFVCDGITWIGCLNECHHDALNMTCLDSMLFL